MERSIILVGHNHRTELLRCLAGLGSEDEIIVVDNGSRDGTVEAVRRACPGVRVIESQRNLGFGGGANLGAAAARGELLVFLNPDTVVTPGWLAALAQALAEDPTAGLVTPQIRLWRQPERINACGADVHLSGLTLCRGLGEDATGYQTPAEVAAVSGAAFAIRRELFRTLGGFDETFYLYMEDVDLSWRARLAGYRCLYVPEAVVYHHYRPRLGPRKVFRLERNRYRMLLKILGGRTLLQLVPALLLAEVVTWAYVLRHRPAAAPAKLLAYGAVLAGGRSLVRARCVVQAGRLLGDDVLLATTVGRLAYEQVDGGAAARLGRGVVDPLFLRLQARMAADGGLW
jgi:GT2 family glycosyltransferase